MAGAPQDRLPAADRSHGSTPDTRLHSWKEIAAYLKRDVTTVRRWEKREGLPIHRHQHERRDSVYAFTGELDEWWEGRRNHLAENGLAEHQRNRRARLAWPLAVTIVVAALVVAFILGVLSARPRTSTDAEVRFSIAPPEQATFGSVSLSPDGRQFAFTAATRDGKARLWIRPLGSLVATPLPATDGAAFPFWSPDSRALGFFAESKLRIVDLATGVVRIVCDAPNGRGGTWNQAGVIVFAPGREGALFRVPASGGSPTPVTIVDAPRERGHLWPEFLPDGRHFLYLSDSNKPEYHVVFVGALDGPDRTRLLNVDSNATYTADGFLLFARDRLLLAQPFDPDRFELSGEPITLVAHVRQQPEFDHKGDFAVSKNGVVAYRSAGSRESELVWRDRSGRRLGTVGRPAMYACPTLSPDQSRLVVSVFDPWPAASAGFGTGKWTSDLWMFELSSGNGSRFTFDKAAEFAPAWSPDGTRIAFSSNRKGTLDLYQKSASGAGNDELLFESAVWKHVETWSPDGRYILFSPVEATTRFDVWVLPMAGDRTPRPLMQGVFGEGQAQISPDGRWIAYTSTESGAYEVYVQSFPALNGKWQISTNGGGDPRWRADGKELYYLGADGMMVAMPVRTGTTFERGAAQSLFATGMQHHWAEARNHYDVSRDGSRFLVMTPVDDPWSSPFTIAVNWTSGLRKPD